MCTIVILGKGTKATRDNCMTGQCQTKARPKPLYNLMKASQYKPQYLTVFRVLSTLNHFQYPFIVLCHLCHSVSVCQSVSTYDCLNVLDCLRWHTLVCVSHCASVFALPVGRKSYYRCWRPTHLPVRWTRASVCRPPHATGVRHTATPTSQVAATPTFLLSVLAKVCNMFRLLSNSSLGFAEVTDIVMFYFHEETEMLTKKHKDSQKNRHLQR